MAFYAQMRTEQRSYSFTRHATRSPSTAEPTLPDTDSLTVSLWSHCASHKIASTVMGVSPAAVHRLIDLVSSAGGGSEATSIGFINNTVCLTLSSGTD